MGSTRIGARWLGTLIVAAAVMTACSDSSTGPSADASKVSSQPSLALGGLTTSAAEIGLFKICKTGNASGTFAVTLTDVGGDNQGTANNPTTVAPTECRIAGQDFNPDVSHGSHFHASENAAANTVQTQTSCVGLGGPLSCNDVGGAAFFVNNFHGVTLTYNNQFSPPAPGQGCSPGYYKKHDMPGGGLTYAGAGFLNAGSSAGTTLKAGLGFSGGPTLQDKKNILLRQAGAAYANSIRFPGSYPLPTAQVIAQTNAALASGNATTITDFAGVLDGYNNLEGPGC